MLKHVLYRAWTSRWNMSHCSDHRCFSELCSVCYCGGSHVFWVILQHFIVKWFVIMMRHCCAWNCHSVAHASHSNNKVFVCWWYIEVDFVTTLLIALNAGGMISNREVHWCFLMCSQQTVEPNWRLSWISDCEWQNAFRLWARESAMSESIIKPSRGWVCSPQLKPSACLSCGFLQAGLAWHSVGFDKYSCSRLAQPQWET